MANYQWSDTKREDVEKSMEDSSVTPQSDSEPRSYEVDILEKQRAIGAKATCIEINDSVWVAAAAMSYEIYHEKKNKGQPIGVPDFAFIQKDILNRASKIAGCKVPSARTSTSCCGDKSSHNRYLREVVDKNKRRRRLSFPGEFGGKEEPEPTKLDMSAVISTKIGDVTIQQLFDFVHKEYAALSDQEMKKIEYWPTKEEYDSGITVEQWIELLNDPEVTFHENLRMFKMMMELGGETTCAKLAEIYGGSHGSYNGLGRAFGERVHQKTNCLLCTDGDRERRYTIPFIGRNVVEDGYNRYSWKIREELQEALETMDLSKIDITRKENMNIVFPKNMILYGPPGTGKTYNTVKYAVAICEEKQLSNYEGMDYAAILEKYNELKAAGRIAFTTFHQSYGYEEFIEGIKPVLDNQGNDSVGYKIEPGIFKQFCDDAQKVEVKNDEFDIPDDSSVWKVTVRSNAREDCFKNNRIRINYGMESDGAHGFVYDVKKGDVILTTDGSRRMINGIAIVESDDAYKMEDTDEDATTRDVTWLAKNISVDITDINSGKMLHRMTCARVPNMNIGDIVSLAIEKNESLAGTEILHNDEPYVFIIDEINRGNISKIFGELITLIEETKRKGAEEEMSAMLPYSGTLFSVPQNVYILGTMNTADRSIALLDTALRRRFDFEEMMPDSNVIAGVIVEDGGETIDVARMLDVINERIAFLYDREHTIGHAFFTKLLLNPSLAVLADIFRLKVVPLLQEYFYEDYAKIQLVLGDNDKSDSKYKFIMNEPVKVKSIFKGNPEDVVDLPETKYMIQNDAFYYIQSYKEIM